MSDANLERAVPFFWVRDIAASLRFYVDGLGFAKTREWAPDGRLRWCWLDRGPASVMLQEFWREGPERNQVDGPLGQGVTIVFLCRDAVAFHGELRTRGVTARQPAVENGCWVTEAIDPDGYRLLFESPTDAPEPND